MSAILAAFHLDDPASLKRLFFGILSGATVLGINPLLAKYGAGPVSDATLESVAGLVAAWLLQSGYNSGQAKAADAVKVAAPAPASPTPPVVP